MNKSHFFNFIVNRHFSTSTSQYKESAYWTRLILNNNRTLESGLRGGWTTAARSTFGQFSAKGIKAVHWTARNSQLFYAMHAALDNAK
jgi:hypothetical protein